MNRTLNNGSHNEEVADDRPDGRKVNKDTNEDVIIATNEAYKGNISTEEKKVNMGRHFEQSRKDELIGLFKEGTLVVTKLSEMSNGEKTFGSRFVDEVKKAGEGLRNKSRLVSHN